MAGSNQGGVTGSKGCFQSGKARRSFFFISLAVGSMIRGDGVRRAVRNCGDERLPVSFSSERRINTAMRGRSQSGGGFFSKGYVVGGKFAA
jgi:hypothetical protein